MTDELVDVFCKSPNIMPHLHLPLQSGSARILKKMGRQYDREAFLKTVEILKEKLDRPAITTDIIVGFPGETDDEWQQTLDFVEQSAFGHIHIFAYSQRQGTKAATLPGQLPRSVKKQRSEALHQLAAQLKRQTMQQFRNRTFDILVEGASSITGGEQQLSGYTPNYLRVSFPGNEQLKNQILSVQTHALADDGEQLVGNIQPTS